MAVLIALLAVVGLALASYFTAVTFGWMRPDARWIPPLCRMSDQTCASIVFTPQARVFGLPNAVFGQIYYLTLIAGAALGALNGPLRPAYLAAAAVTAGLAVYLVYALQYVLRVRCVLCLLAHVVNVAILVLLAAMA